ncbi:MAG TPA: hypothetical protein VH079_07940, partial [Terriglobales bacterium]|nr:hypothetical protein [Terriglobales bacterium]
RKILFTPGVLSRLIGLAAYVFDPPAPDSEAADSIIVGLADPAWTVSGFSFARSCCDSDFSFFSAGGQERTDGYAALLA